MHREVVHAPAPMTRPGWESFRPAVAAWKSKEAAVSQTFELFHKECLATHCDENANDTDIPLVYTGGQKPSF